MKTENQSLKPETELKQKTGEGCPEATFVPPEQYIDALIQRFRKAVDSYSSTVLGGGFNSQNNKVTSARSKMTGAADDIYAFREEEEKRKRAVADISL